MQAVTSSGKKITINDSSEIHRGGEGRILLLKELPQKVAKIYLPHVNPISQRQIQALQGLDNQWFVKPEELIFEAQTKQVIGFIMAYLSKDFFQLAALFSQQFCTKNQIDGQRKLNILKQLAKALAHAHQQQIVIGDLSGLNIMVNTQDEIRLIDVDSYATPAQPHSGVLLDEIRDYTAQGAVSTTSDYFAFAVIAFNLLTYTHPFKGVHQRYKTLQDRILEHLPVFKPDGQLIVPKCYVPITLTALQQQFDEIFVQDRRFLLQLALSSRLSLAQAPTVQSTVTQGEMTAKAIYQPVAKETILEVFALKNKILVTTTQQYLVFDMSNYGYATLQQAIPRQSADEVVFMGYNQLVAKRKQSLWVWTSQTWKELQNFSFTSSSRWVQLQDILAVVEDDYLKTVHLDSINQNFIQVEQTAAFGSGLHIGGQTLWQQAGGKQYVFYHSGKTLSSVTVPEAIQAIYLTDNQGIITYKTQQGGKETVLKHSFFTISQMKLKLTVEATEAKVFAYKANTNGQGLLFEPTDNYLVIRNSENGAVLQSLPCDLLTTQTQLFNTQSGLVAVEKQGVWLLNKRN